MGSCLYTRKQGQHTVLIWHDVLALRQVVQHLASMSDRDGQVTRMGVGENGGRWEEGTWRHGDSGVYRTS